MILHEDKLILCMYISSVIFEELQLLNGNVHQVAPINHSYDIT